MKLSSDKQIYKTFIFKTLINAKFNKFKHQSGVERHTVDSGWRYERTKSTEQ